MTMLEVTKSGLQNVSTREQSLCRSSIAWRGLWRVEWRLEVGQSETCGTLSSAPVRSYGVSERGRSDRSGDLCVSGFSRLWICNSSSALSRLIKLTLGVRT